MNRSTPRTLPPLCHVSPDELERALPNWDEHDGPALVTLASHPHSAERLELLRDAERWLKEEAYSEAHGQAQAPDVQCPPAEELFDFGRGPGFEPMPMAGRQSIQSHLAECEECATLVASLATPPPLPVDLSALEVLPTKTRQPIPALRLTRTWAPFLLAAGLGGIFLLPPILRMMGAQTPVLPEQQVFRGTEAAPLLFPRGALLLPLSPSSLSLSSSTTGPEFELSAVEGAENYRVEVYVRDAGAFDGGRRIQVLHSKAPRFEGQSLTAGLYTWRAFAQVDGLDQPLGDLDFEMIEDARLAREVSDAVQFGGAPQVIELIRKLESKGYFSDARKLAHTLPETPGTSAYLRAPAR
jgi:hypothetical protein